MQCDQMLELKVTKFSTKVAQKVAMSSFYLKGDGISKVAQMLWLFLLQTLLFKPFKNKSNLVTLDACDCPPAITPPSPSLSCSLR